MFSDAYGIASKLTSPIIVSSRNVSGKCAGPIGAYVIANAGGGIVTAGHVLKHLIGQVQSAEGVRNHNASEASIRNDNQIDDRKRRRRLKDGIERLDGFVPDPNQLYPAFKDPAKGFESGGVSRRKIGLPLHSVARKIVTCEQLHPGMGLSINYGMD
ncbi:MAG: hypothetical protein ABSC32_18510 [Steroidobacteraceae bacterium]|jgi:hypothetical protein